MKTLPMSCTNVFSSDCPNQENSKMEDLFVVYIYEPPSPSDFRAVNLICRRCSSFEQFERA